MNRDKAVEEWWRSAAIYQIYPRSFYDTNQDGIGDIKGILAKLDYVSALGADIVWISPFYPSPMKDFGYDVSDYRGIDPIFGQLEDFKALIKRANQLKLKVMIDLVLSHTSDRHPWFVASRADRTNAKADWYVWADPQPDGTPPNNWLSIFGGGAWEWDTRRRQFYFHNFLTSQPDLNFHNPAVVDAAIEVAQFWLDLGVHGFRLDTVNWYFHDQQLRNNPVSTGEKLPYVPESSNYNMQAHLYNKSRPEVLPFLSRFRTLLNDYGAISLGELTAKDAVSMTRAYTEQSKRLHMVYTFGLLSETISATHIKQTIRAVEAALGTGWICWAFSNHDVTRVVSRWQATQAMREISQTQQAKFFIALLCCLRGAICLYQGEELGLSEAEIDFADLQDPYGIRLWPEYKGRDGCRTPMPWQTSAPHAGFSSVKPWLPIPKSHIKCAVDAQVTDAKSVLAFTRSLLKWRSAQPALTHGTITVLDSVLSDSALSDSASPDGTLSNRAALEKASPDSETSVVVFERSYRDQTIVAAFNMSAQPAAFDSSSYRALNPIGWIMEKGGFDFENEGDRIALAGYSAVFAVVPSTVSTVG